MADHLHPTPSRLRYLADAEAGTLPMQLTVAMYELLAAGWIEPAEDGKSWWRLTAYGRAIKALRLLDFGDQLIAETGDEDEPRVLGTAVKQTARQWLVRLDAGKPSSVGNKLKAADELRHMAATALAADPTFTVQEGQN